MPETEDVGSKSGYIDNSRQATTPNFLSCLDSGRLRWDLLAAFPQEDPADRATGDALVAGIGAFMAEYVDPDLVDETRQLPEGYADAVKARGYHRLVADPALGGGGLPPYTVFRMVERAASWSVPAAQVIGLSNSVGATALLPALPEGPLTDWIRGRVADGVICSFGDTDAGGQNSRLPELKATLSPDGTEYVLDGWKLYTANGPITDLIGVTATEAGPDGAPTICVPFVDTSSPGFAVRSHIEFMGSRGLPNAALHFDGVRVPRDQVLTGVERNPVLAARVSVVNLVGRLYGVCAPVTAIARLCAEWSREFVSRRRIDGRPLGEYDEIQRQVAATVAEVFALDTVIRWGLIGPGREDRWYDLLVTKNIATSTCWRIVDRTMSLLGAEGFETAPSKRRRDASPSPLERAFRDARGMRIIVNVDFQLDNLAARLLLDRSYRTQGNAVELPPELEEALRDADLTPPNLAHLREVDRQIAELSRTCTELTRRHPDPVELFARERTLILVNQLASELFTMSVVLARTSRLGGQDGGGSQDLADVYCVDARHRLADLWRRLGVGSEPDYAKISRSWLSDGALDALVRD